MSKTFGKTLAVSCAFALAMAAADGFARGKAEDPSTSGCPTNSFTDSQLMLIDSAHDVKDPGAIASEYGYDKTDVTEEVVRIYTDDDGLSNAEIVQKGVTNSWDPKYTEEEVQGIYNTCKGL